MNKEKLTKERNMAFCMFFDAAEILLYYGVCRGGLTGDADFSERVNESLGVLARDLLSDLQKKDAAARGVLSEEEIEEAFCVCEDPEINDVLNDLILGEKVNPD